MDTNMKPEPESVRRILEDLNRCGDLPSRYWIESGLSEMSLLAGLIYLESEGKIHFKPGTGLWSLHNG